MIDKIYSTIFRLAQVTNDGIDLPNQVEPTADGGFLTTQFQSVLQVVFGIMGAVAVLIITIAAFQYVISAGDPQKVSKAKDAILYALIGLVVAILSFAIVSFVIDGVFS